MATRNKSEIDDDLIDKLAEGCEHPAAAHSPTMA